MAKYGEELIGWISGVPLGPAGYGVWKGIREGAELISRFTRLKVNNGEKVLFWHDTWCASKPLSSLFSSCYSVARRKWGSDRDHMIRTRVWCSWNIHPKRNLND